MRPEPYPLQQQLQLSSSLNNSNTRIPPLAFESLNTNKAFGRLPSAAQVTSIAPIALSPSPSAAPVPLSPSNVPPNNNKLPPWQPALSDKVPVPPANISINNIVSRNHLLEPHEMTAATVASKSAVQYQQSPSPSPAFDFPRIPHQPSSPAIPSPPYPVHSAGLYGNVFYAISKMNVPNNNNNSSNANNNSSTHLPRATVMDKRDTITTTRDSILSSPQEQQQQQMLQRVHSDNTAQRQHTQQDPEPFRLQPVPSAHRDMLLMGSSRKRTDQEQNNAFRHQLPLDHHLNRIDALLAPNEPPLVHHEHEPVIQLQSRVPMQREQNHDHRSLQPRQGHALQLPATHPQVDNTYGFPVHSSSHESPALRKGGININNNMNVNVNVNSTELLPWEPSPSQAQHSDATQSNPLVSNSTFPPAQLFDLGLDIRQPSNNSLPLPIPLSSPNTVSLTNSNNAVHRSNNNVNTAHHLPAALPSPSPEQQSVKPLSQELSLTIPVRDNGNGHIAPTTVVPKDNNTNTNNAISTAIQQKQLPFQTTAASPASGIAPSKTGNNDTNAEKRRARSQRGRKRKGTASTQNGKQAAPAAGDTENSLVLKYTHNNNPIGGVQPANAPASVPRVQGAAIPKVTGNNGNSGSSPRKRVRRKNRDVNGAPVTPRKRLQVDTTTTTPINSVHCPYCKLIFDMKRTRDLHVRTVHEKSFPCDKCPSLFKTKSDANRHIRIVHEGIRPFSCDTCPATFAERGKLRRHKNTVHEKLRPFSCTVCNATFGERGNRNQHQTSRHAGMVINSPKIASIQRS